METFRFQTDLCVDVDVGIIKHTLRKINRDRIKFMYIYDKKHKQTDIRIELNDSDGSTPSLETFK